MSHAEVTGPLLRNITLIVEDIERAKQFYTGTLGFKILKDYGDYVSIQTPGGILIGLHAPHDGHTHMVETRGVEFSFLVDNVDRWYERLASEGIPFSQKPKDTSWGTREAYMRPGRACSDNHLLVYADQSSGLKPSGNTNTSSGRVPAKDWFQCETLRR